MSSTGNQQSYIVIGAGCFGASTAYHLAQLHPSASITLIDRTAYPNPSAAAHDINKIIRADYPDALYMALALEAQDKWRHDPIFSPFYHEPGMLFAEDFGMGRDVLANYKNLFGDECPALMLDPVVARKRFPMFKDANWEGVKQNYFNPTSGWGEADKALESIIRAAIDLGVTYLSDPVVKILIDEGTSTTTGIITKSGKTLTADSVVLCAGAYTETLLADSAPNNKLIHAQERLVAAAAVSCYIEVPEDRRAPLRGAPVMFNGLDHTHGEAVPLNDNGLIKFNFELSFTNRQPHIASGQMISVPPSRDSARVWSHDVPEQFKEETRTVMKHIYGSQVEGVPPKNYRMCWYVLAILLAANFHLAPFQFSTHLSFLFSYHSPDNLSCTDYRAIFANQ